MVRVFTCLTLAHDWRLVILAGVVCFLASVAAISLFHRARALHGRTRVTWLLTAGTAAGSGIWATHFIAALAFNPGLPVSYGMVLTGLSLLIAIVMSALGLAWALYASRRWQAALGGGILGAGIVCMHYTGMAGLQIPGHVVWSFDLVAASVFFAVVLGAGALMLAVRGDRLADLTAGAVTLTLAILALHFTAMGAAGVIPDTVQSAAAASMSPTSLALAVAAVAGSVLAMCLIGALSDRRSRKKIQEQNLRLDAALNNMNQGLCMFDADNRLLVWNQRYVDMYNIHPTHIWLGCTIRDLLDARIAAGTFPLEPGRYDDELRASLRQGRTLTLNIELNDGRVVSVVNQPTEGGGWVATHEDITERKRAERALEHTRHFLDTILENVPSPILVKGYPSLRYLLINRAAEEYLGVEKSAMLGKTAAEALPTVAALVEAQDRKMVEIGGVTFTDEHAIETPGNGTRIVTSTRLPVMDDDGKPEYLITVVRDLTDRKRHEQRIAHMAHHDSLTDLPNRAAFNECLAATIDRASLAKESFALLCIDLDRFKEINDVFGHSVGDAMLREAAVRLQAACEGAFVARVGGDEFSIVTPAGVMPEDAARLAERLGAALDADIDIGGNALRVGLTIGVALYPQDGVSVESLIGNADAALYRAKAEARGSVRFYEISMDRELRDRRALQQDLRMAIGRNELALHYQPQAQIDGGVTGFEALARWHHPTHGMVPPGVFIPLAEESGSIIALGEWILRSACREAASWPRPLHISINLSPVQFQHGDLPALVHEILLETGLAPGRLELEITEGVLIGDFTRAVAILRRLKNLGVRIAMDDFGTGYSSLSYLQSFPFDKIKIDQAFIANLSRSRQSATIIRAVIALGRGLALPVVAEGVETEEQLQFLASESCDGIQGYYVGRPKPIVDYADMVGRATLVDERRHIAIAS
jgi:diguanylate cyclase (GGDEF)-like protein/PAS domain S-box-containing protein